MFFQFHLEGLQTMTDCSVDQFLLDVAAPPPKKKEKKRKIKTLEIQSLSLKGTGNIWHGLQILVLSQQIQKCCTWGRQVTRQCGKGR